MTNKKYIRRLVKTFLEQNDLELQQTTLLLGGPAALQRLQRLRRELGRGDAAALRLRRELDWLHGLLTLRHVHDFDRVEAAYFAELSPEDPVVEKICVLTDVLAEIVDRLDAPVVRKDGRIVEQAA